MAKTPIPEFTQVHEGEAVENKHDEEKILAGAEDIGSSPALNNIENEPEDFMRGDIDVKTQMDRAARELNASVHGRRGPDVSKP